LLSGGLDSSLVAAMAAKRGPLHSYCIGYEGFEKYDERSHARKTAVHIGSEHHEILFGKEDFFRSIEHVVDLLDEPLADPAMLPLYHLMQRISDDGFRVVLTGDGSDELFMGYKTYAEFADLEQLGSLKYKSWLRNHLKSHFSMHREWEWHKRIFEGSLLFRGSSELFTDLQQNRLLRRNIKDNRSLQTIEAYRKAFEASGRNTPADWYSYIDIKILLGEVFLKKLDRVGMANGIEARTPFLDKEVVAAVLSEDAEFRMGSERKHLLKTIALEYLPASVIQRKKKGFNYPFLEWLQEENAFVVVERVQKETGMFREEHLHYLIEEGRQGKFRHQLFSIYMLCRWLMKTEGKL
jgi:asparagine synthase (glutamine-hydrolysing)